MAQPARVAFRALTEDDLGQLFLWLIRPHVRRSYAQAPSVFEEVRAKYGPRSRGEGPVRAFVVQVDGRDAGYAQTYPVDAFPDYAGALGCGEGVAAIDLFIGEPEFLHRGLGTRIIRRFLEEIVFAEPAVNACIAGPADGNEASIRAFEKAGFARWKRVQVEGAQPECVMRLERVRR